MDEFDAKSDCADSQQEEASLLEHRRRQRSSWSRLFPFAHWCLTATLLVTTFISLVSLSRTRHGVAYEPFVPQNVLKDPEVLNYGYYVDEPLPPDTFDNITIMEQRLKEIGLLHMSTAVMVNGDYRHWIDENGNKRMLYPKVTPSGDEIYLVASFHTMHCLMATIRDYGYLINGYKPKWSDAHTLHCFNKFYNTIACLAESVVEGYKDPQDALSDQSGEIRRASEMAGQAQCRNYAELKRWASHPSRAVPFYYNSGHNETKELLPEYCNVKRCRTVDGWVGE